MLYFQGDVEIALFSTFIPSPLLNSAVKPTVQLLQIQEVHLGPHSTVFIYFFMPVLSRELQARTRRYSNSSTVQWLKVPLPRDSYSIALVLLYNMSLELSFPSRLFLSYTTSNIWKIQCRVFLYALFMFVEENDNESILCHSLCLTKVLGQHLRHPKRQPPSLVSR